MAESDKLSSILDIALPAGALVLSTLSPEMGRGISLAASIAGARSSARNARAQEVRLSEQLKLDQAANARSQAQEDRAQEIFQQSAPSRNLQAGIDARISNLIQTPEQGPTITGQPLDTSFESQSRVAEYLNQTPGGKAIMAAGSEPLQRMVGAMFNQGTADTAIANAALRAQEAGQAQRRIEQADERLEQDRREFGYKQWKDLDQRRKGFEDVVRNSGATPNEQRAMLGAIGRAKNTTELIKIGEQIPGNPFAGLSADVKGHIGAIPEEQAKTMAPADMIAFGMKKSYDEDLRKSEAMGLKAQELKLEAEKKKPASPQNARFYYDPRNPGRIVPTNVPASELPKMGFVVAQPKTQEDHKALLSAKHQLQVMREAMDRVDWAEEGAKARWGKHMKTYFEAFGQKGSSKAAIELHRQTQGYLTLLARLMSQEKGNVSNVDVERANSMWAAPPGQSLMNPGDTREIAYKMWQNQMDFINEKLDDTIDMDSLNSQYQGLEEGPGSGGEDIALPPLSSSAQDDEYRKATEASPEERAIIQQAEQSQQQAGQPQLPLLGNPKFVDVLKRARAAGASWEEAFGASGMQIAPEGLQALDALEKKGVPIERALEMLKQLQ